MKNSTDISKYKDIGEFDPDTADLLAGLETLHDAPVPVLTLPARSMIPSSKPVAASLRRWRLPVLAAAVAAAAALFLAGPSLWGGGASEVSAQTIIQRTQGVAANSAGQANISYHLVATKEAFPRPGDAAKAPALGMTPSQESIETWYLDASHWRSESHDSDMSVGGQARDGNNAWLYRQGDDGILRVVHGPASLVADPPNSDESEIAGVSNIADVLAGLGSDNCHTASITGNMTVAGRDAYAIDVMPTPDNCSFAANVSPDDQAAIRQKLSMSQEGKTTLVVDKQTFVTLSIEIHDKSGAVLGDYKVTRFETGSAAAAGYAYQPPAGVQVAEVTSPGDAKMQLSGAPADKPAAPQNKDKVPAPNKTP